DGTEKTLITNEYVHLIYAADDWVYYRTSSSGSANPPKLYRMRVDGTEKTLLSEGYKASVTELYVVDGWVYYYYGSMLYRVRTDGTGETQLGSVYTYRSLYEYVFISDGWIYSFVRETPQSLALTLQKMRADGTEKTALDDSIGNNGTIFAVVGDWVYYSVPFGEKLDDEEGTMLTYSDKIYKIRTDGTDKQEIVI
ncbi:MAG: DUF5050 domain-containing protein, partial [Clostridiales bacterium]|nr:DUF5050 domain-containing protein [Clostridiales bacterium]